MKKKRIRPLDRKQDISLPEAMREGTRVMRILQKVRTGDVIILSLCGLPPHPPIITPLHKSAFGVSGESTGPSFVYKDLSCPWSRAGLEPTASFNCNSYALGSRVGLSPGDWIEGEPTDLSMATNPMAILLSAYFRTIKILNPKEVDRLPGDSGLREDDIVSFTREHARWGTLHDHSGRIKRIKDDNWMVSKFGTGRLLASPIAEALRHYPETENIRIYRFRKNT